VTEEKHGVWRSEVFMVISEFGTSKVPRTREPRISASENLKLRNEEKFRK
jgi:hypothetical protein